MEGKDPSKPARECANCGAQEDEDTKLNPVCAIASPLADGKLTKKALKVVKKGTRVLFFFVQQRGERRRRFFF